MTTVQPKPACSLAKLHQKRVHIHQVTSTMFAWETITCSKGHIINYGRGGTKELEGGSQNSTTHFWGGSQISLSDV